MSHRAPGPKRTPHKPGRDTQRAETAELKRENHQLKRAVARLRKQVDQLDGLREPDGVDFSVEETEEPRCPSCRSRELLHIPLPSGKTLVGCSSCQWRAE